MRRPVAVAMTYVAIALLGLAAWRNIPLELMPDQQLPRLSVQAEWPGSSPEAVEALVTSPLEGAIQQLRGVERVASTSEPARTRIDVEFSRATDMDFARLELSERLAAMKDELPPHAAPQVLPYVPRELRQQRKPFLEYTVTGPYTSEALRAHVRDVIAPEITQIPGVNHVEVHGGRDRLLVIELDPVRLEAVGVPPFLVQQGVQELEYAKAAGRVEEDGLLRTVAIRQGAESAGDILALPVLTRAGRVVRVGDIGRVHDTLEDARGHYRIDGLPAVSFTVHKERGENVLRLADAVKVRLADLERLQPTGSRVILDEDESAVVRGQLSELRSRAVAAVGVILVVLLLFLASFASAALVVATMAFSVLVTLNLIYFGGFTLNALTLMGIAMGFGLIVDNALVVLESVFRRRELGDDPATAAERGASDVALPVLAATLTTVVVLVPFVYLQGDLRLYYVPLAMVVAFSLLASLVVAFTFIPAGASRILSRVRPHGRRSGSPRLTGAYAALLGFTLRHPAATVVTALGLLAGSYHLFVTNVTRDVLWGDWWGRDSYIDIHVQLRRGEDLARVDRLIRRFEERLRGMPDVDRFVARVQPSFGDIQVTFPDSLATTGVPAAIKEQLLAYGRQFGGMEVRVSGYGPSFYGAGAAPPAYSIEVSGYEYGKVREIAEDLGRRLTRFSRIRDVDTHSVGRWQQEDETELLVSVDRGRLALHDLSARDVVRQVAAATRGGATDAVVRVAGEEVRLSVELGGDRRADLLGPQELRITTRSGSAVRVRDVATLREREVPGRIEREDQRYRRFVAYEFRGAARQGERVQEAVIASTAVPPGYNVTAGDRWRWNREEKRQIHGVVALSVLLVFMVTAALFESLRQPLTVLLAVPMALVGVFLTFVCTGASFTREAYVGVIMMGGIVVNNAILLVDHINRLRRVDGMALEAAVVRGALERARPILMTSATTIGGLLPLVLFSASADASIWNAPTYALVGGLVSSTVLVLAVTPALYQAIERRPERRRLARSGKEAGLSGTR